jgi:hypothetical protein
MRTNCNEYRRRFSAELESWICREDGDTRTAAEYCRERFEAEMGWRVARVGRQSAMAEWLQGLALCGMPYYNSDALELYERLHGTPAAGKLAERVIEGYWRHCAVQLMWIMDNEKKEARV